MSTIDNLVRDWRTMGPVKWAEHGGGWIHDDGKPIALTDWQRAVLEAWWEHREYTSTVAISNVKKTGKTTLDAVFLAWRWLALPGQHYVCANDMDQSQGLQFRMIAAMVKRHPFLSQHVRRTASKLTFEPTDSELEALSVDAAGSAGSLHLTSSHTEAWGIQYEAAKRAWEELSPQPGEFFGLPALRIADSYAGWEGESQLWHDLVERGKAGTRVSKKWPIYWTDDGLLLFHIEGENAQKRCFRGNMVQRIRYYKQQRASLRPAAFKRMHENEETAGESAFITVAQWRALPQQNYQDVANWQQKTLSIGLDVGVKHDYTAVCSVFDHGGQPHIGPWRVWKPPKVSFEAIEDYLVKLKSEWRWMEVWADPYQAQQLIQRLTEKGIRISEFPQTVGNLTEAGNRLFEAIRDQRLVVPPGADELRDALLGASAKETERGLRLVKTTQGRRIDLAIALAMGLARLESEGSRQVSYMPNPFYDGDGDGPSFQEWDAAGRPELRKWVAQGTHHSPAYHAMFAKKLKAACEAAGHQCLQCAMRSKCTEATYDDLPRGTRRTDRTVIRTNI